MEKILQILKQLHVESYQLLKEKFNNYYDNAGNIGIFCQSEVEFAELSAIKETITLNADNELQKYFVLKNPIIIPKRNDIPEITYTHLYIRKPDPTPYGKFRGDIDFYTSEQDLKNLKSWLKVNETRGTEIYHQNGVGDLIQLSNPQYKTVAYISTKEITENIRVRH